MRSAQILRVSAISAMLLCASSALIAQEAPIRPQTQQIEVVVFKNPSCGCCEKWVDHMRHAGFHVTTRDESDMSSVKKAHDVPPALISCHTAVVEGYVIEGHVPADVVAKLLKERPPIAGLAVAGMPIGSPGMEMEGRAPQSYDIIAFTRDGKTSVFAKR